VASTERAGAPSTYLVPEHVRVRQEDFGLLFYDTRSTRLIFVRSGERLAPPPFTGARRVLEVRAAGGTGRPVAAGGPGAGGAAAGEAPAAVRANAAAAEPALRRLLDDLVAKGLLEVVPAG
jgi:putative mycofactocin binding protein MftB